MRDFCFSLQTVLATKGVIYFSAWSLYLYIPSRLCFVHICEVTEAREFPCCTSGSPSLTFTLLLLREEGTSRDKQGGVIQDPSTEGFFLSATFSTMNTKCTGNCFMWLFLHFCFCSAPTKDFFLIPHLSRFLVSAPLQPSWIQWEIPKAAVLPYVKCLPCTSYKGEKSGFKVSHKILQYYSMMLLTWSKMKSSLLSRCKMRAPLFLVNCTRCRLCNYK